MQSTLRTKTQYKLPPSPKSSFGSCQNRFLRSNYTNCSLSRNVRVVSLSSSHGHVLKGKTVELESEADKKRVLHLACCLLPKPNRDTLEVLFLFLKWVSTFAEFEDGSGSKMDLHNLATVLAPNILYPKHKDPAKEDSHAAISTVYDLLQYQEEFAIVRILLFFFLF